MGLMDMLKTSDPMAKFYAAAEKSNVPQGGITGKLFSAMFPHGLGNLAFGRNPEPMPPLETPEGTALMADLASNMMVPGTFIGPKGLARLFGDDAAKGMLATAESKLAQGVPKEAVFQELGVFKGPDGKWRYEIDDSGFAQRGELPVSPYAKQTVGDAFQGGPVGAYDIAEIPVMASDIAGERAAFMQNAFGGNPDSKGVVTYNPEFGTVGRESDVLHELQHAIQRREGFAEGGSPSSMRDMFPDFQAINDAQVMSALVDNRGVSIDDAPAEFLNMLGRDSHPEARVLLRQHADNFRDLFKYPSSEFDAYKRLAGEAEAYDVQKRMGMSIPERRSAFPDYAQRDDLIIRGLMSGARH